MKRFLELLAVIFVTGGILALAVYLDWLKYEDAAFLLGVAVFMLGMKHGRKRSD